MGFANAKIKKSTNQREKPQICGLENDSTVRMDCIHYIMLEPAIRDSQRLVRQSEYFQLVRQESKYRIPSQIP